MKITSRTHILFVALIIVIVFSGSLKNDFTWDDKYLIVDNPYIKSWGSIREIFTTQLYESDEEQHSNFYRPMQLLSYLIDYSIWGLKPFGYHLTNLFLHIFNAALVYLILIAISSSSNLALLTALLFGISPTISGITYYASARSDLLMSLFMFLSLLFFIKYRKNKIMVLYIFSISLFIFALLCKEMAMILLMLLILEIFRSEGKITGKLKLLLPYLIILIFYIMFRFSIFNFARGPNPLIDFNFAASVPLWKRILTDFKIIPKYLGLLLFPYPLHMEWFIEPAKTIFQKDILFSIAILFFLVIIIKKISRLSNLILFGAFWFLLTLLPVLNIYPISVLFGEGWLYLPSIGFFIVIAIIFQDIEKWGQRYFFLNVKSGKKISLTPFFIIFFLLYYSLFTISYGKVWRDPISLFHNILKYESKSPFIYLTYNNLSMAYYNIGDFKKSMEYCKKSISLNPKYPYAYNNLGVTYIMVGSPIKAIAHFKKAISLKKDYIAAYCNLAHAYNYLGLKDNAAKFLKIALNITPYSYKIYCNLGYVFSGKGDIDKAIEFFKKACETKKASHEPYYGLGSLYIRMNKFKEALDEYKKALRFGLNDYMFYNELSHLYIKNNKFKEAERLFKHSLILNSNQAEPHNNLGNLYSMSGFFELAMEEYRKALDIDMDNLDILSNIKKTKAEWKNAIRKNSR